MMVFVLHQKPAQDKHIIPIYCIGECHHAVMDAVSNRDQQAFIASVVFIAALA